MKNPLESRGQRVERLLAPFLVCVVTGALAGGQDDATRILGPRTDHEPASTSNRRSGPIERQYAVGACDDADGDGYGSPGDPSCPAGPASDCNDANPAIHP